MKRTRPFLKTYTGQYALLGVLFGLLFPILATGAYLLNAGLSLTLGNIIAAHMMEPLLWIIDTAPLFLGLFAAVAGYRQDKLKELNQMLLTREQELEATQLELEERVNERTRQLTLHNQLITERADLLKLVVEVARVLLSVQEMDRLLPRAAKVIGQQFGYYHVGIYLIDEQKQYAVLLASSSQGGKRMIERDRHFRIGGQSLVEFVIRSGQARVITDTTKDPLFKIEPELPNTHSELMLALKAGQTVIGVLDLQADDARNFSEEYVSTLGILADLLTIAIQNSMLHEKIQLTLRDAEVNSKHMSSREWSNWMESIRVRGYRYDGIRAVAIREAEPASSPTSKVQSIPIRLRGRTIGSLKLKLADTSQGWTEDDRAIAEATAERTALALEGARLLEEAKRRAAREAFLSEIAAKLGTSFRLDSILRDTVEELGQSLKGSTVSFQLIDPTDQDRTDGSPDARRSSV